MFASSPVLSTPSVRQLSLDSKRSPLVRSAKSRPAAANRPTFFVVTAECKNKHVHVCTGGRCEPRGARQVLEFFKEYAPEDVEVEETFGECLLECPSAVNAAMWTGDWDPDTKDTRPVLGYFENRHDVAAALREALGVEPTSAYKPPSFVEKAMKQNTINIEVMREGDPKWKPKK